MRNRIFDDIASAAKPPNSSVTTAALGRDAAEIAREQFDWSLRKAEQFVATHPVASLSTAVGVGVAIGWWLKRR